MSMNPSLGFFDRVSDPGYLGNSPYPSSVMYMFSVIVRVKFRECLHLWWGGWDLNPRSLVPETSISPNRQSPTSSLRPSCPHRCVVWTTAPAACLSSMIQNALVLLRLEQCAVDYAMLCYAMLRPLLKGLNLHSLTWSNSPYLTRCTLETEIALFRLLTVGWGFLVSVEVCSY